MTPRTITDYDYEWTPKPLKNGRPGKRGTYKVTEVREYCPVRRCGSCGRFGSAILVQYRSLVYRSMDPPEANILCMGCWNTKRSIQKMEAKIAEAGRLIRELKRETKRGNKVGGIARAADGDHRSRAGRDVQAGPGEGGGAAGRADQSFTAG